MSVVERGFDVREHEIIQRTTKKTRRAYVELRQDDADGDEMIVAAIFSYRRTSIMTKKALMYELATKARHLMKRAAVGLDRGQ